MTFYYWYQVRGETLTRDIDMKLAEFKGMLLHKRKDAAFIRLNTVGMSEAQADIAAKNFFVHAYPFIKDFLPS